MIKPLDTVVWIIGSRVFRSVVVATTETPTGEVLDFTCVGGGVPPALYEYAADPLPLGIVAIERAGVEIWRRA